MTVRNAQGRVEVAFVEQSTVGRLVATFASALNALTPPLPSGPAYVRVERDCVIRKVTLVTYGGTGSCVVDIWVDSFANFPPTSADSICAAAKPTISSGVKYEDTVLSGWDKQLVAGDVIAFNLDSNSTFYKVVVILEVE